MGVSPKRVEFGIKKNQRIGENMAAVICEECKMLWGPQNGEGERKAQSPLCLRDLVEVGARRPFHPETARSPRVSKEKTVIP